MNIINGKNASAVIFAAEIEAEAIAFVEGLCDSPSMAGSRIAQMPDVHHGKDCNVGTVYTVGNYLNPSHIGGDIGCAVSMHGLSVPVSSDDFALLDHRIREAIPTGIEICSKNNLDEKEFFRFINSQYQKAYSAQPGLIAPVSRVDAGFVSTLCRRLKISEGMFYKSIGTLGGGNHFIEYGEDGETGQGWLTIHTGSRNFGQKVAGYWQSMARNPRRTPFEGYLCGEYLGGYLSDMVLAQAYAQFNHIVIRDRVFAILRKFGKIKCTESIFSTHNYISLSGSELVLRKGAVDASCGRKLCIPFNMRDGIAICVGKGNDSWLGSAPHGAGRHLSRAAARKELSMDDFRATMAGVYSSSVCEATIDESPMAYKAAESVLGLISPTVDVVAMVRPKLNIKDIGK